MISKERLRELIERILRELEAEAGPEEKKIYMLCTSQWDERFYTYLTQMEKIPGRSVYPVIPLSWKKQGIEERLLSCSSCKGILYRSGEKPTDLESAVTVLPVVQRDVVVKTALCIGDTFETSWITACMESGGPTCFLRNGLSRFTGKEPKAYINQILSYYRQVLELGIKICEAGEEYTPAMPLAVDSAEHFHAPYMAAVVKTGAAEVHNKKRVITASNVEQLAADGILYLCEGDIITDLARDRAKFLNIVLK